MELVLTADGTHTIYVPELDEHYHSVFGAVAESIFIYIQEGLRLFSGRKKIVLFECGFGTGLNALLTCIQAGQMNLNIEYHTIEKFPLPDNLVKKLNYPEISEISNSNKELFYKLHSADWNNKSCILEGFFLNKIHADLTCYEHSAMYDLVYFDAFDPEKQPELWSEKVFRKLYEAMNPSGILVTYSVKGEVRRALQKAGFSLEKIPGPKGKREILRAVR